MNKKVKYISLALFLNAISGTNIFCNQYLITHTNLETANFLFGIRFILAGVFLLTIFKDKEDTSALKDISPKLIGAIFVSAIIGVYLFRTFNSMAFPLIASSLAGVAEQLQGLFLILLNMMFLKKIPNKSEKLPIAIYITGAFILVIGNGLLASSFKGIIFVMLSVLMLAISDLLRFIINKRFSFSMHKILAIETFIGGIFMLVANYSKFNPSLVDLKSAIVFLYLVATIIVTKTLWAKCSNNIEIYEINIAKVGSTLMVIILDILFYSKLPTACTVIAALFIFISLWQSSRNQTKLKEEVI